MQRLLSYLGVFNMSQVNRKIIAFWTALVSFFFLFDADRTAQAATITGYYTYTVTNVEDQKTYPGRQNFQIQMSGRNSIEANSSVGAPARNGADAFRQRTKLGQASGGWHVGAGNILTKSLSGGAFLLSIAVRGKQCNIQVAKTSSGSDFAARTATGRPTRYTNFRLNRSKCSVAN